MLAYVRDGSTIGDCLTPYLAERQNRVPDPFLTEQLPRPSNFRPRTWPNPAMDGNFHNPGPIAIWHLWLS